ncbi:MAG: chemotaxis protein CheW [Deltaproteobacteria bacterium]|nr:chemotaxis protein CheW [Deltaproteobacteria bacterium]
MPASEDIVIFKTGNENFSIALKDVSHILEAVVINIIPRAKSPVMGIISTRGKAVVVVDMTLIAKSQGKAGKTGKIIILRDGKVRLGLYIGDTAPSFLYKDDEITEEVSKIDWKELYEKVETILRENIDE